MSTSKVLVSKYNHERDPALLEEMVNSRAGWQKVQEPGIHCCARKEVLKSDMGMPNTEANFKNVHNGKTWDNLSIKVMIVMDHLLLSKRNLIP